MLHFEIKTGQGGLFLPSVAVIAVGILDSFESIWVHGRHDVYPGAVDEVGDFRVLPVVGDEIVNQMEQQLPPHSLLEERRAC